jgi:hypothetical protein
MIPALDAALVAVQSKQVSTLQLGLLPVLLAILKLDFILTPKKKNVYVLLDSTLTPPRLFSATNDEII